MPDIYPTIDGSTSRYGIYTWNAARDSSVGDGVSSHQYVFNQLLYISGRGATVVNISRYFIEFDTSGISVAPEEAFIGLYGRAVVNNDNPVIVVRGTQATGSVATDSFNDIYNASTELGNSDASGTGTLAGVSGLTYSSTTTSWSTSGYNLIPLNATALADIASMDEFKVCVMATQDYLDSISVGYDKYLSWHSDAYSGTSRDPLLKYTAGTEAVTHNATFFGCNF